MTHSRPTALPLVLLVATAMAACGDVPIDDTRNDARLFPARGVIRGTVTYVGPRPCSQNGHIVGNAVVLVFDRRNPPPPAGIATAAVNFVAVPGDALFVNEPRSVGPTLFCPSDTASITASVPFTIAPLQGGSYQLSAFYDRRGRFWPTFKFRNLPEAGDIGGGFIDLEDARKNAGNPNYQPLYLPVDVGTPQSGTGPIPDFVVDQDGYVADNIPVTVASVVPFTRPYFHPRKNDASNEGPEDVSKAEVSSANPTGDKLAVPIIAMTQDAKILAPPKTPSAATLTAYQRSFLSVKMVWGVAPAETTTATSPNDPFGLQLPPLPPNGNGGLLVYGRGVSIPENPAVPDLWPQVAFIKLADDPLRRADPQSLVIQGTPEESAVTGKPVGPVVIIQGITLLDDSLAKTIVGPVPNAPTSAALRDHVTVLVKPAALCFDPRRIDVGGLLVTPHLTAPSADASEVGDKPVFDATALARVPSVREIRQGCLPKGRYAMTLVYSTGQAWTVPNEIGGCAPSEGAVRPDGDISSCSAKPRHVLLSQGARAVLEVVEARPEDQATCDDHPVPDPCTKL
ncbi:MAG: hypothetical protein QOI41_5826 [Myxococcales bacterium]|nr:hypothetical protein [Myxococcales bacterium]